jgi:hypothetical protein
MSDFDKTVDVMVQSILTGTATIHDVEAFFAYVPANVWIRIRETIEVRLEVSRLREASLAS